MNYLKSILIGSLLGMSFLALFGCVAGTGEVGSGQRGPGIESSGMAKGSGYFLRECNKCHRYFMPSERSAGEWAKILAGKKNKVSLTRAQFQQLSDYVIQASSSDPAQP
ncbi:MAG: hypothetical protein D9V46_05345 [Deltaproteobacteria bacterium]|uniref:hypothetical protein n=1 Tax=Hydrosulfovibrio ferrireducens TaxID=2934181 RepID=UPI00120846E2|nr:MAG: hypothetical protein D9V46_05345 [Deltaproteobacteria bacterium]